MEIICKFYVPNAGRAGKFKRKADNGWKYFGPRHICMHKRFNRLDFMTDICFFVKLLLPQILYMLRALCGGGVGRRKRRRR